MGKGKPQRRKTTGRRVADNTHFRMRLGPLQLFLAGLSGTGCLAAIVSLVAGAPAIAAQVFTGTVLAISAIVLGLARLRR